VSPDTSGTFGHIQGILGPHSGNIRPTFREHSGQKVKPRSLMLKDHRKNELLRLAG
jgi:hypothetical protein